MKSKTDKAHQHPIKGRPKLAKPDETQPLNCQITQKAMDALRYAQYKTKENYGTIVSRSLLKLPKPK